MKGSAGTGEKRKFSREDEGHGGCHTRTLDNRKRVYRLDPKTFEELGEHESQRDAASFVQGNDSQLSQAIRYQTVYKGFMWRSATGTLGPADNDNGGGAGCQAKSEGRRLVASVDLGHAGTGYAIDYKGTAGLFLFCTSSHEEQVHTEP